MVFCNLKISKNNYNCKYKKTIRSVEKMEDYDVTKDKGRITVRNVIDDPETRKELNPYAEQLDKENGIED